MRIRPEKVALVYDRVNKFGGAERVLLALHKIWPHAPLFTAVYDRGLAHWAEVFDIRTSFLQALPFARRHHELIPWLMPVAFSSFNFDAFDVVISVTSAEAKGIITRPETLHICYCLTPTRYLWSGYDDYQKYPGLGMVGTLGVLGLKKFAPMLRTWDLDASSRPDKYIAISEHVKKRLETYYHVSVSSVIYPPIDVTRFARKPKTGEYFLTVSRLVGYKRIDLLIDVFNKLGSKLIIIGHGKAQRDLQNRARENITFISRHLTDSDLAGYYQKCLAFVFAGEEDFGIVAGEAQASGKPVICFKESGMAEIIDPGKTGILFEAQTANAIMDAIADFQKMLYNKETLIQDARKQASKFDEKKFRAKFSDTTEKLFAAHRRRRA